MLQTVRTYRGMVTAPHHLATQSGLRVLEEGGTAIEAMVAAASTLVAAYPHMNGIGGDNFWLVHTPGGAPIGIDACGASARLASCSFYGDHDLNAIPSRGALAALTVAGAVSGWAEALEISTRDWGGRLPLHRLLEDAIHYARNGVAVTRTLADNARARLGELRNVPGFGDVFLNDGRAPAEGERIRQPRLADTLACLADKGLDDFYRGDIARSIANDLERSGSPLRLEDLEAHRALRVEPLSVGVGGHRVLNLPPPTQGLASLMILGVFDRLHVAEAEGFDFVHGLVEATKCAFRVRDRHVTDPAYMKADPREFLADAILDSMVAGIDRRQASPWPAAPSAGDTVWLGAIDGEGRAVSFIQSLYWEFGSGLTLPETGITWQNRGTSFSLDAASHNTLMPGRRPFHTIQPAMAHLADGRTMVYGTMGGEGQPQTQAMLFSRHVMFRQGLQEAVTAPRWLLGRTWGTETTKLRIENRFDPGILESLAAAGHDLEVIGAFEEAMGHAGALVHHPNGLIEGASDPRSDGVAAGF